MLHKNANINICFAVELDLCALEGAMEFLIHLNVHFLISIKNTVLKNELRAKISQQEERLRNRSPFI